jgi:hypothetical protein
MSRIRADQLVNRAGSGGPKFPHGVADGFSVSGIVTATSFRGDGSQLQGIDATALKDGGGNVKVQTNTDGIVVSGIVTATTFTGSGANVTSLNASELSSGTIPDARIPNPLPAVDGSNLTNLNIPPSYNELDSALFG